MEDNPGQSQMLKDLVRKFRIDSQILKNKLDYHLENNGISYDKEHERI